MAPRRVIDFLRWAESYHSQLAEFYKSRMNEASRPEVKGLLAYMARHQIALRHIIEDYEHGASKAVLDAWYKISPALEGLRTEDTARFHADMTISETVDMALDLDRGLIAMYEELVRRAESESLREYSSTCWKRSGERKSN